MGRTSRAARDWALQAAARAKRAPEIIWDDGSAAASPPSNYMAVHGEDLDLDDLKRILKVRSLPESDTSNTEQPASDRPKGPLRAAE